MKKLLLAAAAALACAACATIPQGATAIGAETSTELGCCAADAKLDREAPAPTEAGALIARHDSAMVRVGQVRAAYDRTLRARAGDEENDRLDRARGETDDACGRYRARIAAFAGTG